VNVTDVVEATIVGIQRAIEVRDGAVTDRSERFSFSARELPGTFTMGIIWKPREDVGSNEQ